MRRRFPTSIYSGFPRPPRAPSYRKVTWLDQVRAERRLAVKWRELERREAREKTVQRIIAEATGAGAEGRQKSLPAG